MAAPGAVHTLEHSCARALLLVQHPNEGSGFAAACTPLSLILSLSSSHTSLSLSLSLSRRVSYRRSALSVGRPSPAVGLRPSVSGRHHTASVSADELGAVGV